MLCASVTSTSNVGVGLVYNWAPTLGTWYHVAFTYDSATGSQKLYIDGDLKASNTTTATPGYDGHPVLIGADHQTQVLTQTFAGKIDDVRIWNVPSEADVQGATSWSSTPRPIRTSSATGGSRKARASRPPTPRPTTTTPA